MPQALNVNTFINNGGLSVKCMKSQRFYTTLKDVSNEVCLSEKLNPDYVTGFCDGESSLQLLIQKSKKHKNGYSVSLRFAILLHTKDLELLKKIKSFFGVGYITTLEKYNSSYFHVSSQKELKIIIDHFNKYPLSTKKQFDFLL